MNWENILKQPELEQPPIEEPLMEEPLMEEPMIDPTTGLPIDPMAQQADMAVPPTPVNPNPTGEKEFPVDPEVEDDAKLNKWFSTVKKQTNQQMVNPANQARIDRKKKEAADKQLAQQQQQQQATAATSKVPPQLQNVVRPRPNQGRVANDAQARANAKKNRQMNPTAVDELASGAKKLTQATIAQGKKVIPYAQQKGQQVLDAGGRAISNITQGAKTAVGSTARTVDRGISATKPLREGAIDLVTDKQKGRYGTTIGGSPKKEGSRNLALGKVPRKAMQAGAKAASKEKGKWKDALRESQEKVRDTSSEAAKVADLQRRSEFFRQQKLQQQKDGTYEGGPIEYTNPDGSKEIVDRGGTSTEFGDFADAKGGSIRDPKTGKLLSEKGLSEMQVLANNLNIDWKEYNSNPKYKEVMQRKITRLGGKPSRVDAYSDYLSGKQERRDIKPVEATAEQSRDRYETEIDTANRERREAQERQKLADEDAAEERAERQKKKDKKKKKKDKNLQKQDRRDDPALWESWDGGLVDY